MSKPMLVTWPFVMLLLDYWPLGCRSSAEAATSDLPALSCRATLARLLGEDPVLCPCGGGERRDLRGAEARRRCGGGWKPAPRRAHRERPDFVLPLSGEAVLADGSGGLLSAPRAMAAGEGDAGGWVDPGHFGAVLGAAAALSLFAGGVAVVCRDAGARDRVGASGRPGDGGSVYLSSIAWSAGPRRLGHIRTDPRLAASVCRRCRWRVVRRSSSAWR